MNLIMTKDLIITKSDKRTGTDLMNNKNYIDMMNNILSDHPKLQKGNDENDFIVR